MKIKITPKASKPYEVYRIIDRETGEFQGSYSRAYSNEYDFESIKEARTTNVHGIYEDKEKYKIAKYRVVYQLIEVDCDKGEKE